MSQQPISREQTGRLILEACAGVHGDVAMQLADAWCAMATEIEALCAQVESLQAEVNEQARLNGMGAERAGLLKGVN